MPTTNPRVNVTFKPHEHELLGRLAKHQRSSRSAIVREVLDQVFPVFERLAVVMDAAEKASEDVKGRLRQSAEEAERDLLPLAEKVMGQLDMFVGSTVAEMERIGGRERPRSGRPGRRTGQRPPTSNHGGQVTQAIDS